MKNSKTVFNKIAFSYAREMVRIVSLNNANSEVFLSVFLSKINFRDLELFLNKDQRRAEER